MKHLASIHCKNCPCKESSAFCGLCPELLDELHQTKAVNVYKRNQVIFYEGNVSTGAYCIQTGKVKIYKTDEEGHEQILSLATTGDLIGYRSLLTNQPHSVTAAALEDTTLCFIDRSMFLKIFQRHPQTASQVAALMGEQLRQSGELTLDLAHRNIRERFAEMLLVLAKRFGIENDDGCQLDLALSRRDMANMIGTSEESVVRLLSEFKDDGLVHVNRREITLCDSQKLADTANLND